MQITLALTLEVYALKVDVHGAIKSLLQGAAVPLSVVYLVASFILFRGHIRCFENDPFHGKSSNDQCYYLSCVAELRSSTSLESSSSGLPNSTRSSPQIIDRAINL